MYWGEAFTISYVVISGSCVISVEFSVLALWPPEGAWGMGHAAAHMFTEQDATRSGVFGPMRSIERQHDLAEMIAGRNFIDRCGASVHGITRSMTGWI